MSTAAPALSSRISGSTLGMQVANMTFMLERLAQDCAPLQFVRELTQNAIESVTASDGRSGEIRWDVDWNRFDLEPNEGFKLAVIDTGIGMTGPEMEKYINKLSSSMHEQATHGNFGMGAKIAAAPRNTLGLLYLSWKEGKGSMIHLWKDPDNDTYGLRRHANGEFWLPITNEIRPEPIKDHGTMVVLLGNKQGQNTIEAPEGALIPTRWVLRYLNTRYFRFPQSVTVKCREGWELPRNHKHNALRKVTGQEAFLKNNSEDSGCLALDHATAHWWILKEKVADSGDHFHSGHVAALFGNELYEFAANRSGIARLQSFGVIFGYNRIVIYIEPQQADGRLTANTARTSLLIDGQPLPWTDWASEFREKMPDKIAALMDRVAAGASNVDNTNAIRERLKQIKDLFKFTRYRPNPDGAHTMDEDMANAGGKSKNGGGNGSGSGGGGRKRGGGGRAGDIYSLFADTGETPAEEVGGFPDPKVTWVSLANKTRTNEFLEDRAAKYLPETNTIQANSDFRVFTDMMSRWCKFYEHIPNANTTVESVAKEWFQQQLVETVLGALALRRSGNWSEVEIEGLWSEEALTSAVLPRYHVDQSIKRTLGSKLGTLKDKDVA